MTNKSRFGRRLFYVEQLMQTDDLPNLEDVGTAELLILRFLQKWKEAEHGTLFNKQHWNITRLTERDLTRRVLDDNDDVDGITNYRFAITEAGERFLDLHDTEAALRKSING